MTDVVGTQRLEPKWPGVYMLHETYESTNVVCIIHMLFYIHTFPIEGGCPSIGPPPHYTALGGVIVTTTIARSIV